MIKHSIAISLAVFASMTVSAQSCFTLEVRQVFPKNVQVYINDFNFRRDMEKEQSAQTQKLKGNDRNYKINITLPNGQNTASYIQNINWVQVVNGTKTYHKSATAPKDSYKEATVWTGSACAIDGTPKGTVRKDEFVYRVTSADGSGKYVTEFITLAAAKEKAAQVYAEALSDDHLVEVKVLRFDGEKVKETETLSNKDAYNAILARRHREDSLAQVKAKREAVRRGVENFKRQLSGLEQVKDSLKNGCVPLFLKVIEESVAVVPDSVFVAEQLDSIYGYTLSGSLRSVGKNRKIQPLLDEMTSDKLGGDSIPARTMLIDFTQRIKDSLFPPEQANNKPQKTKKSGHEGKKNK